MGAFIIELRPEAVPLPCIPNPVETPDIPPMGAWPGSLPSPLAPVVCGNPPNEGKPDAVF
jgi:hypothetical protein